MAAESQTTTAIVRVEPPPPPVSLVRVSSGVSMVPKVKQTVEDLERVRRFVSSCLNTDMQKWERSHPFPSNGTQEQKEDWEEERRSLQVDWGTIPGVEKPFLMQPGAEKFLFWLELKPKYFNREIEQGEGHLEIVSHVVFCHKRTKEEVFEGPDCSCTTLEDNFRFIWAEKKDPCTCANKFDCFKAGGACDGGRYKERQKEVKMGKSTKVSRYARGRFVGKEWAWFERVEVPNIHNKRNNVRQIGQKRALVKGVRNMGAISEIFTQPPDEWDIPEEREDTPETEMDYTPGGRRIYVNGKSPSGRNTEPMNGRARQSSEDVAKSKAEGCWCEKHKCDTKFCPSEEHTAQENEEAFEREERRKRSPGTTTITPASPAATPPKTAGDSPSYAGRIEVDCTNPDEPIVRGDLSAWVEGLEKHCAAKFRDGWWRIPPGHVSTVEAMCKEVNYDFVKIDPVKKSAPVKKNTPKSAPRATPGEHVVSGIIEKAVTKGGKSPRIDFLVKTDLGSFWMGCFSKTWFTLLAKEPLPKPATLVIKTTIKDDEKKTTYRNILRATKIGNKEYDEDGKEVLQVNREPGSPSLFRD